MKHFLFILWCKFSAFVSLAVIAAAVIIIVLACCKVSSRESRRREREEAQRDADWTGHQ